MRHVNSETITSQGGRDSETGTQLGAHGSETRASSEVAVAWLVDRKPQTVDKALQSQASSLGVDLRVIYDSRSKTGEDGKAETVFFVKSAEARGDIGAFGEWLSKVKNARTPAPRGLIEGWLAELSVKVVKRADDEFTDALRLEVYARDLAAYPADVAKEAVLGRRWKYWPAWAELEAACAALSATRTALANAFYRETHDERAEVPQADPEQAQRELDERRLHAERVLAGAGFTPKRIEAVRKSPMARSVDEAMAKASEPPKPHWSEGLADDHPDMIQLRKSRQAALEALAIPRA